MLKISVQSSGAILLDGNPVDMEQLEDSLKKAKEANDVVWYYREASAAAPPPQAMQVIQLVVKHKLTVTLSSKSDFSDYVDASGSHPRTAPPAGGEGPRMPEVDIRPDIEEIFANTRKAAAGKSLILVRPDRQYLVLPKPAETSAIKANATGLERMIPSAVKRNVVAIAYTGFATGAAVPSLQDASKSVPFLGILMGLSYIGHSVWIFEGHASALAAGCRDADVLIVDSGMRPFLHAGWEEEASKVMRNANILFHDRATFQLRVIRKVGSSGALEFAR